MPAPAALGALRGRRCCYRQTPAVSGRAAIGEFLGTAGAGTTAAGLKFIIRATVGRVSGDRYESGSFSVSDAAGRRFHRQGYRRINRSTDGSGARHVELGCAARTGSTAEPAAGRPPPDPKGTLTFKGDSPLKVNVLQNFQSTPSDGSGAGAARLDVEKTSSLLVLTGTRRSSRCCAWCVRDFEKAVSSPADSGEPSVIRRSILE
jgi:hypothetical protein